MYFNFFYCFIRLYKLLSSKKSAINFKYNIMFKMIREYDKNYFNFNFYMNFKLTELKLTLNF
jgi:hypothetical protein